MLRRLGIRAKVMAVLAVPMIVLLAAGGFISWNAIQELRYAKAADSVITTLQAYTPVSSPLQAERLLSLNGGSAEEIAAARAQTDAALDAVRPITADARPQPVPAAGRRPVRRGAAGAQHDASRRPYGRRHQVAAGAAREQLRRDHRGPAQPHGAGRQQPREPRPGAVRHRLPRDRHHRRQPGRRDDRRHRAPRHPRAGPRLGPRSTTRRPPPPSWPVPAPTPPWTRSASTSLAHADQGPDVQLHPHAGAAPAGQPGRLRADRPRRRTSRRSSSSWSASPTLNTDVLDRGPRGRLRRRRTRPRPRRSSPSASSSRPSSPPSSSPSSSPEGSSSRCAA